MLELRGVHTYYGKAIHALAGISLEVRSGEIVTLIGANGAGKTTLLKTVSGLLWPAQGEIVFEGRRIDRRRAHEIAPLGIVQVPEGRKIFPRMTVEENLEIGLFGWDSKRRAAASAPAGRMERAYEMFPVLRERRRQPGGTLSGGEQQMLAISRGLMAAPKLLMLDEPSMGLAPTLVEKIFEAIRRINREGVTILLVEQNAALALQAAARAYVLETGRIVMEGPASKLLKDPKVKRAYLGGG